MTNNTANTIPAPWKLRGDGFILAFKPITGAKTFTKPKTLMYDGGYQLLMVVDYQSSTAGPYRELLYIPGKFTDGKKSFYQVTDIYVSTQVSVESGQANWGIPKKLAESSLVCQKGLTHFSFSTAGEEIASFAFSEKQFKLPFTTAIIPKTLRTLKQENEAGYVLTSPSGRGQVALAKLESMKINPALFPSINRESLLFAFSAPQFELIFPKAEFLLMEKAG